jgi:ABC-type phosphate/phosphonate transport system permease subunit
MAKMTDKRQRLLAALLEYAKKSGTFNPHFYRSEMIKCLGVTEGEFNIMQSQLGEQYCSFAGVQGTDSRYEIHVDKCLELWEKLERHRQLVRTTFLAAVIGSILGAVVGVVLSFWFLRK